MSSQHRPRQAENSKISFPIAVKNSDGRYMPSVEGLVSFNKANGNDEKIDMTLHLLLKNKKEQQRSRSLPRQAPPSKRLDNDLREAPIKLSSDRRHKKDVSREQPQISRRTWSKILSESEHPASYIQVLPERDNHHQSHRQNLGHLNTESERKRHGYGESNGDKTSETDEVTSLTVLNPVRTLQFLLGELHSIVKPKGEREQAVFRMIEDVVSRLPNDSSPFYEKRQPEFFPNEQALKHPKDQISRTAYEILRKERDGLHSKLDEKCKTHLALERKLATAEAKIVRLKSERQELQENYSKMIEEQKALIANLPTLNKQNSLSKNLENHLENELKKAHIYIAGLEKTNRKLQDKYKAKFRIIQDILNNGLDFQAKDNPRLTDVIGVSPLEAESLDYPEEEVKVPTRGIQSFVSNEIQADVLSTSSVGLDAQKYIDKVMMNSGLLRSDQEHLFQSFHSIADRE
ncbi:uncharacterized protein LOC132201222 [Neocloeon triangulifer]|uniref:uncharacterized protein LOC132201222 n=1 Tax=Neocloeon triangulifer TaxID=2078957 RepID=UPI00286F1C9C|nr:uncharacterized protein LOC132201222 [Neocloeon triangulifer]